MNTFAFTGDLKNSPEVSNNFFDSVLNVIFFFSPALMLLMHLTGQLCVP